MACLEFFFICLVITASYENSITWDEERLEEATALLEVVGEKNWRRSLIFWGMCCGHSLNLRTGCCLKYNGFWVTCFADVVTVSQSAEKLLIQDWSPTLTLFCGRRWHQGFLLASSVHPTQTHPTVATSCLVTSPRCPPDVHGQGRWLSAIEYFDMQCMVMQTGHKYDSFRNTSDGKKVLVKT